MAEPVGPDDNPFGSDDDEADEDQEDSLLRAVARIQPRDPVKEPRGGYALTPGTHLGRFQIVAAIGRGGMGEVYRAHDPRLGRDVALKLLPHVVDATAIYRFKNEFRALADLTHPNLVALHELIAEGEQLFFSMDLIDGVSFLRHVRAGGFDGDRLRGALLQLARAVATLHGAGQLHRDIKPSNVLVTREGRVVLLDFGLVTERLRRDDAARFERIASGTPEYMSPEQAAGGELSEASDWYSVGAMLFEALTGQLPFDGPRARLLLAKQAEDAPSPRDRADGLPDDLAEICVALLRRDPRHRLDGREVLARLGDASAPDESRTVEPGAGAHFVGRAGQLAALRQAFDDARGGRTLTAFVHGASGMGKTVLVRRFLESLVDQPGVVLLRGRCYERETVPYKALDSIVDDLGRHLQRLPRATAEAMLPPEVLSLARLFPVLRAVEAVAAAPRSLEAPDPLELRRRAFGALRELLARLTTRSSLVLWIDDLQWGDVESAALLAELLRPPDAPPLLLIASYRTQAASPDSPLGLLRAAAAGAAEVREIAVEPLDAADAEALAASLLGGAAREAAVRSIAAESAGNPYFIDQLVGHVEAGMDSHVRLDQVVGERVRRLPAPAQRLLELVAVAGRPIPRPAAARAVDLSAEEERHALALLSAARLLRTVVARDHEQVETYHDRIRETVVAQLPAVALAAHHRRIALSLEAAPHADPEELAFHFEAAGEPVRAAELAIAAADRAAAALAFDRAAKLYRRGLALRSPSPSPSGGDAEATRSVQRRLAGALANAGRGAEAARAYTDAAAGAGAAEALELSRRAAEELLRCGHVDEGLLMLRRVLAAVGLPLPESRARVLASIVMRRALLRLRGRHFRERDARDIAPEVLTRLDVCWSVATGLGAVSLIRSVDFQLRHMLLALEVGEPHRVLRGLAMEITATGLGGGTTAEETRQITHAAEALAARLDPFARAFTRTHVGAAHYMNGRWSEARAACDEGGEAMRNLRAGITWESGTAHLFSLWSLYQEGALRELTRRHAELLRDAEERGDLYLATLLRTSVLNAVWLAADDPERARAEVDQAMARWSRRELHNQHYFALLARVQADLYQGRGAMAVARIAAAWTALDRALIFRVQMLRLQSLHLRARATLAAAAERGPSWRDQLAAAERDAERIDAERMPWAAPVTLLMRAAAASLRHDSPTAARLCERARAGFEERNMRMWAAAAQRRRGQLVGGAEGRTLVDEADARMGGEQIRDPRRFTDMLAPGFGAT